MNQFWIFLIVIGISVVSSIIGKLKEQAEINRAREAARRRREEEVRTGQPQTETQSASTRQRPAQPSQQTRPQPASREDRMREVSARRQAELRDLRERQARERAERESQGRSQQVTQQGAQQGTQKGTQVRGPSRSGAPPRPTQRGADVVRPGTPQRTGEQTARRRSASGDGDTARDAYLRRERERQREIAQTREIEMEAQRKSRDTRRAKEKARAEGDDGGYKSYIPLQGIGGSPVKKAKKAQGKTALSGSIRELLTGGTPASRRERLQQIIALNEILEKPVSERESSNMI